MTELVTIPAPAGYSALTVSEFYEPGELSYCFRTTIVAWRIETKQWRGRETHVVTPICLEMPSSVDAILLPDGTVEVEGDMECVSLDAFIAKLDADRRLHESLEEEVQP
jgi:hypothetical protein